ERVTCVEIDPKLVATLRQRFDHSNVTVVNGDAAALPFPDASFSGAVAFTMLHHVPSPQLQDRILAEVCRVLRPGGTFAGTDSRWSIMMPLVHLFDTMVLVPPESMLARLQAAGFTDVTVETAKSLPLLRAQAPALAPSEPCLDASKHSRLFLALIMWAENATHPRRCSCVNRFS